MRLVAIGVSLLALAAAGFAADNPGKAVFDQTCKKCHGAEGKGDPGADKFFQIRVPRLASEYVQKKSDDELREVITKGRRKMQPVRLGQPVAQHSIDPKSVDDVIGYVRTLKK